MKRHTMVLERVLERLALDTVLSSFSRYGTSLQKVPLQADHQHARVA